MTYPVTEQNGVKLHISPATVESLPKLLGPKLAPQARNISFHSIVTFPERAFAYVTLPPPEAAALQKKYHGFILKGQKMNVESARGFGRAVGHKRSPPCRRGTRTSNSNNQGRDCIYLSDGRSVKRGWAEPGLKTKTRRSKYTSGKECLFRMSAAQGGQSIHEFEKTTKFPTFLRVASTNSKPSREFVENKGWIDTDGQLVEMIRTKSRPPIVE